MTTLADPPRPRWTGTLAHPLTQHKGNPSWKSRVQSPESPAISLGLGGARLLGHEPQPDAGQTPESCPGPASPAPAEGDRCCV